MAESQYFDLYSKKENSRNRQQISEEGLNLSIRRAEHRDIDELAVISRTCYPYLLRWQGPYSHGRKRWQVLLDTDCCEAWVCLINEKIIGYFTLIFDKRKHDGVDGKPPPGLFVRLYMLAASPKLFITIALGKLKQRIRRSLRRLVGLSSDDEKITAPEILKSLYDRKVLWFGYVAVIPAMKGKGVATEMIRFCFQRAVELGHREVWVYVERKNVNVCRLMRKAGFEVIEGINHLLLKKQL